MTRVMEGVQVKAAWNSKASYSLCFPGLARWQGEYSGDDLVHGITPLLVFGASRFCLESNRK